MPTVTIAHATFAACFVAVLVRAQLAGFDRSLEEAASDLGARPWTVLWRVTLPGISPALISGWLLAFTMSLDDLVIASFVSGPAATTLPMAVYSSVRIGVTPEINALATVFLAVVLAIVASAFVLMGRQEKRRRAATSGHLPHRSALDRRMTKSDIRVVPHRSASVGADARVTIRFRTAIGGTAECGRIGRSREADGDRSRRLALRDRAGRTAVLLGRRRRGLRRFCRGSLVTMVHCFRRGRAEAADALRRAVFLARGQRHRWRRRRRRGGDPERAHRWQRFAGNSRRVGRRRYGSGCSNGASTPPARGRCRPPRSACPARRNSNWAAACNSSGPTRSIRRSKPMCGARRPRPLRHIAAIHSASAISRTTRSAGGTGRCSWPFWPIRRKTTRSSGSSRCCASIIAATGRNSPRFRPGAGHGGFR